MRRAASPMIRSGPTNHHALDATAVSGPGPPATPRGDLSAWPRCLSRRGGSEIEPASPRAGRREKDVVLQALAAFPSGTFNVACSLGCHRPCAGAWMATSLRWWTKVSCTEWRCPDGERPTWSGSRVPVGAFPDGAQCRQPVHGQWADAVSDLAAVMEIEVLELALVELLEGEPVCLHDALSGGEVAVAVRITSAQPHPEGLEVIIEVYHCPNSLGWVSHRSAHQPSMGGHW